MKPISKFICLVISSMLAVTTFGQIEQMPDTSTGKGYFSLEKPLDTTGWKPLAQHKSSDTVKADAKPEVKSPNKKYDKRWFISPLLKFQAQDFGMLERQRMAGESDAHLLSFNKRSNVSAAASVYKNFSGHLSASIDLGASMGHIAAKDSLVSGTKKKVYGVGNATVYYHLLGGNYRLQPFIAAGINGVMNDAFYISAPVGAGVKFTSKKLMVTAQGAYGYSMSDNIANTLMYSVGIYIPIKSKKEKEEEQRAKDSMSITNITNNYYYYNLDSMKRVQDSLNNQLIDSLEQKKRELDELDPDDPMRLPAAVKYVVYFYYDQYALTSSAFGVIDEVVSKLKSNKTLKVHLKGHTDMAGSEQYNAPLSKKRAQMVFDYLNSRGVPTEKIVLSSYGKKSPAVRNEDPNTAWMNRRCEIVLFDSK